MSPANRGDHVAGTCFPRASGDEPASDPFEAYFLKFSPGMSLDVKLIPALRMRFPRASGDEPTCVWEAFGFVSFSPRERG